MTAPASHSMSVVAPFLQVHEQIESEITQRMLQEPGFIDALGDKAANFIKMGLSYTSRALMAAVQLGEPDLLTQQIAWALDRLPHDGVDAAYIVIMLRMYRERIREHLPEAHSSQLLRFLDQALAPHAGQ